MKIMAVAAVFFFSNFKLEAQGNFVFTNNSGTTLDVELFADYDDCMGNYLCNTGIVSIAPGNSHTFNTCTANGAWKYMTVADPCGNVTVGYCGFPGTGSFLDCNLTIVKAKWIDEHTGKAQ